MKIGKYESIKLWLGRDLTLLIPKYIPWNATVAMNVKDRKLPPIYNPYEGKNIFDQDNSKYGFDLTLRVLAMKDMIDMVGKTTRFKEVTTPTTLKSFKSPPRKSQRELKFIFLGPNRLSKTLDNRIRKK